jgi:hypothetical protein
MGLVKTIADPALLCKLCKPPKAWPLAIQSNVSSYIQSYTESVCSCTLHIYQRHGGSWSPESSVQDPLRFVILWPHKIRVKSEKNFRKCIEQWACANSS